MKVAIYTRVSSERQVQEGFSLEAQHDRLLEYIKMNGWDLVRFYTDPGVSGKNVKDRPGFQEMLVDLKQEKFDALVIHKIDRLTRNIGDLNNIIELFNKKNIKLISFSENIDTSTASGRMFVFFLGVFAQMYRENLAEEVTKGLTKRAEKGLRVNFKPIFGYDVQDYKLYINEEQAVVVRLIYDKFLKGWGKRRISDYLNDNNYQTNFGIWYERTVNYILTNVTYIGKHHYTPKGDKSKTIIKDGDHAPIIDEEKFTAVQVMIERKSTKEISRSSNDYPFSSIMKCGQCGHPYHGKYVESRANKKPYRYYRCYGKYSKNTGCTQSDISEITLEKILFNKVLPALLITSKEENIVSVNSAKKSNDHEKIRRQLERDIAKSDSRKKNWHYAFGDGKLPYEEYVRLMDEELLRVNELKNQLNELGPDADEPIVSFDSFILWFSQISFVWKDMTAMDRKLSLQTMFKKITISKVNDEWDMKVELYK
jgi:site-specific DNA recombinase